MGKLVGKRPLGRPWCKWGDNIRMDLKRDQLGGYRLDRSGSGQGQELGSCEFGNEHLQSIKCRKFLGTCSVSALVHVQ